MMMTETPQTAATRSRLAYTIRSLFVREHALITVLSGLEPFIDDARLLDLISQHGEATRMQVKRLRCIASIVDIELPATDSLQAIDDVRHFAQHIGHRLTQLDTSASIAEALMHIATVELSLYRVARLLVNGLSEQEAAELLHASEEEESQFAAALRDLGASAANPANRAESRITSVSSSF
jgi:ferritin-like metal-binding protein YciE